MKVRPILGGIKSFLPLDSDYTGTGGTVRGTYCYSVWLRHLALTRRAFPGFVVDSLVEFGPGDTIGTGLAALVSGTNRYYALDVLRHVNARNNLSALEEVVRLMGERSDIPDEVSFPGLFPRLPSYSFGQTGLSEAVLQDALRPARVASLRREVEYGADSTSSFFEYVCPWTKTGAIPPGTVDMVLGQVVLQDMDDNHDEDVLSDAFKSSAGWLRRGGVFSQQIDLSTPGGHAWNDHWTYPDAAWWLVRGRRPYYHNRAPLSRYVELCGRFGLDVVNVIGIRDQSGHAPNALTGRFSSMTPEDATTRCAYLLAVKS